MKTNKIKLNKDVEMDTKKFVSVMTLLQASTGGGKSWAIRRILEQSFAQVPHIILDTEGEFSTLREKFDYILIEKGGQIEPTPKTAKLLAQSLWRERVSAIIDLYELSPWERQEFVKNFVNAMVDSPKEIQKPVLLVIDEAHEYAPEGDKTESGRAIHLLASKGRKRKIGVIYATQRISTLSKNVVAACKNKLIGYTSLDTDMKRASAELGFSKEQALSLRQLDPGEFYAFGPAISKEIIKFKIGPVATSHGDEGESVTKVAPASDKVKKALAKLAELPQEAKKEAETIASFKTEISQLKNTIRQNQQKNVEIDPKVVEKAVFDALSKRDKEWVKVVENWKSYYFKTYNEIKKAWQDVDIKEKPADTPQNTVLNSKLINPPTPKDEIRETYTPKEGVRFRMIEVDGQKVGSITGGALRMLKVLVSRYPTQLTKSQLATFAKLKPSSGTFSTYISTLKSNGYIQFENNLFKATEAGIEYLGEVPNPPQSSEEIIGMWQSNLTGGARRMFDVLIETYPASMTKEVLGEVTSLNTTSGTFSTYLSILRSNGLINVTGQEIKISDNLFI